MSRPKPEKPGPGQESVWSYPRPPRLEPSSEHVVVRFGGETIVDTRRALRMLETSHPPTYYLPPSDAATEYFVPIAKRSFCEWKGEARYFDVWVGDRRAEAAAWSYPKPVATYAELRDYLAVYVAAMDECLVDGERVEPQPGDFYGGWVTSKVVGPFKGVPGSWGW